VLIPVSPEGKILVPGILFSGGFTR
jgi:hypothetical protein